jgi:hypothetical protein
MASAPSLKAVSHRITPAPKRTPIMLTAASEAIAPTATTLNAATESDTTEPT